ncbi:type-F conjugative transfer system mating-pair stabilization protein TraN [Shewanella psychropiezotolerans]|uniref:Type-F conjugative transfer system mating-pair stabilization protein TraN n=1 Tax=Shewanella psychropiezotolerans TaxID=2593655 RepID=A0ABX5WTK5_9GAMM|nr:type-F conjugative transfer system mating-pair stabilization protein TraN [Shewanella psychropiezotolerans]QDO82435.1 type-F conjugative transfer system mating-pair stabilization protein TraN [Shewanella psychropiezotolerans]
MRSLLLLMSLVASLPLMATNTNTETDYRNQVQWAKDSINHNQHKPGFTDFDVNALCKDAACQRGVANPAPSRYLNNASALRAASRGEASSNAQSQAVTASFNKGRPTIDENDPAYHAAIGYQNDAYNISHGISSKYHDCDKGLRCDLSTQTRTCTVPTHNPVQCHITPYLKSSSSQQKRHTFTLSGRPPFSIALPAQTASVTSVRVSGNFTSFAHPLYLELTLNGSLLGRAPVQRRSGECARNGQCPSSINSTFNYQGETSSRLTLNVGTILGSSGYALYLPVGNLPVTIVTTEVKMEIGYRNSCGSLLPVCQQVSQQCVEGPDTRMLNGIAVTLDCWDEQLTYQCNTANTCAALSECQLQSSNCKTQLAGVCIEKRQRRLCETRRCQDVGLVCGEDSFALSGDYYDPSATQSPDFNRAAAGLAAMGEAGQDVKDKANINENSAIIFKGDIMRCSIKAIGLSNCCQDSGWGNDIGITSCSEEEKALGHAKEGKLTISLGQYCAERVLGLCIRKKKSYCAFSSKLARIVQEEGKAQLGLNFGSAKHPDCRAFTPNQLQHIDMSRMDFSDFYEDLHDGMALPNTDEIKRRLQRTVGGDS